jgi:phage anti-repressor protein
MLTLHKIEGKDFINSVELYRFLGLSSDHYPRWYKNNIILIGDEKIDYHDKDKDPYKFPISEINQGRPKREFYVSLQFAHGLCMVAKTSKSKKIRQWIRSILQ